MKIRNCTIEGEGLRVIARTGRDGGGRDIPRFDLYGISAVNGGGVCLASGCTIGALLEALDRIRGDIDELIYRYDVGSRIRSGALEGFLAQWDGEASGRRAGEADPLPGADGGDGGAA